MSRKTKKKEIDVLLNEKGGTCLTISLGLHSVSSERIRNKEALERIERMACEVISKHCGKSEKTALILEQNLHREISRVEPDHYDKGLGIFISEETAVTVYYPFYVNTAININAHFSIRDLLYYKSCVFDYRLVSLSKKRIRLFKGYGPYLEEVHDEKFPYTYTEEFEYSRPTIGTSYGSGLLKNYERDKTVLQETRMDEFFRAAYKLLVAYDEGKTPIMLMGLQKEVRHFIDVSHCDEKKIVGIISGEHQYTANHELSDLAWNEILLRQTRSGEKKLSDIGEMFGQRIIATGVQHVWDAANEGKGLELIVEKDFQQHAFFSPDKMTLYTKKPLPGKGATYVPDAVEEIIRAVKEKNGEITFVDNESLLEYGGVVLKLRY